MMVYPLDDVVRVLSERREPFRVMPYPLYGGDLVVGDVTVGSQLGIREINDFEVVHEGCPWRVWRVTRKGAWTAVRENDRLLSFLKGDRILLGKASERIVVVRTRDLLKAKEDSIRYKTALEADIVRSLGLDGNDKGE